MDKKSLIAIISILIIFAGIVVYFPFQKLAFSHPPIAWQLEIPQPTQKESPGQVNADSPFGFHNPKVIFADEPTANLDSETSDQVIKTFLDLNKEGQTIIMVTHEPEYAKMAHRTITMADGNITSDILNK